MLDLFAGESPWLEPLAEDAVILRRYAREDAEFLLEHIERVNLRRPFQHRITPGGHRMSVAMTHSGLQGGYPESSPQQRVPLDSALREYAIKTAAEAGFRAFRPDSCLMNRVMTPTY